MRAPNLADSISLVCILAIVLAGCSKSVERPSDPLRAALYDPPLSFDPHLQNDFLTSTVLTNVFEALTRYDGELQIHSALAASWESPDPLTWRFHLRPGVVFHDGRPLTADDVVASLERGRHHPSSKVTSYLAAVSEVRAVDSSTVDVITKRPYAVMLNKLAFVAIVARDSPAEIVEPVGTGPYRLLDSRSEAKIVLESFVDYWGVAPAEPQVELIAVGRSEQRLKMLLDGEVDWIPSLRPRQIASVESNPCCRVVSRESLLVEYLGLRTSEPPLNDLRVRRAIDLALDRSAMVERILMGHGQTTGQLVTYHVVGYIPERQAPKRDLESARKLLSEAGYPDGLDLELEIEARSERGEMIRSQLAEAGIRVSLATLDWQELYGKLLAGDAFFHLGGMYAESGDASDILDEVIHSREPSQGWGAANGTAYSNPILDSLIEQSGRTMDELLRRELLQECQRLVLTDTALIPLFVPSELYGVSADLEWTPRLDSSLVLSEMRRFAPE